MSTQGIIQDEFGGLGLTAGQGPESNLFDAYQVFNTPAVGIKELYRPENLIPDEAHMVIWKWEMAYLKQKEIADVVESTAVDPMEIESFDNHRTSGIMLGSHFIPEFAPPPKRFYRTFWKSLTRQVVRREKKRIYDRAALSNYTCPKHIKCVP
jgi:hypothetical protein